MTMIRRSMTLAATAALAVSMIAAPALAAHEGVGVEAELTGFNEVGETPGRSPAGDASGEAYALVYAPDEAGTTMLCLDLHVERLQNGKGSTVTGVHVHEGTAGENGPVVANFTAFYDPATRTLDGCVDMGTAGAVADIVIPGRNADEYYVNLHTERHPGGAVRGQLD